MLAVVGSLVEDGQLRGLLQVAHFGNDQLEFVEVDPQVDATLSLHRVVEVALETHLDVGRRRRR